MPGEKSIAAPVSASERIHSIDVVRGFALLGILLANLVFFAHPVTDTFDYGANGSAIDATIGWFVTFLAQGKFYPLFSLLFGFGFAIQLERAQSRGGSVVRVYLRRLLVLMAIGVVHGVFIWAGDILAVYALLGFLLLLIGRGSAKRLLVLAVIAYGLQAAVIFGAASSFERVPASAEAVSSSQAQAQQEALSEQAWAAYTSGSYAEITVVRAQEFAATFSGLGSFGLQVFAMFLFGAWLGRQGHFANPGAHRRFFSLALVAAVGIGVPLSAWYASYWLGMDDSAVEGSARSWANLVNLVAGPALTLGYVSLLVLGMQTRAVRWIGVLAPLGRMALTNYLLQSVVMTLVFYPYGFGMMAKPFGAVFMISVAIPLYAFQILFSHWWMARFCFGPAEWLWRSLTYLRLQPMRAREPAAAATQPG